MSLSLVMIIHTCFFFFQQKTSYEMRISDWSSDVCSSDLREGQPRLMFAAWAVAEYIGHGDVHQQPRAIAQKRLHHLHRLVVVGLDDPHPVDRSEEHTSALQSLMRIS